MLLLDRGEKNARIRGSEGVPIFPESAMSLSDQDRAFLELALRRNLLTRENADKVEARLRDEAGRNVLRSAAEVAIEERVLSERDAIRIDQDLWIQALPSQLGDYRLVRLLGRGGMAAVFEGRDLTVDKPVAIKVLLPRFTQDTACLTRFRREATLAAKPSHPNTVQVYHYGVHGDTHFIVMEYVDGQSVSSMIRSQGPFGEVEALDIAIPVARSLAEAHEYGIIHRDVKPSNIRISKWGVVKLMDFGIAKLRGPFGGPEAHRSVTLGVVGTPHYLSPEVARGGKDYNSRTDMYSLGATMYHMFTGEPPYEGEDPLDVLRKIVEGAPPDLHFKRPDLSQKTCAIVLRMMARDPEKRYESFAELIGAMEEARKQVVETEQETTAVDLADLPEETIERPARRDWLRTVGTAAIVVAIGLILCALAIGLRGCG